MKWRVAHVIYMHIPFSVRALTSSTYEATPCISPDAYNQAKFNSNITSYIAIKKIECLYNIIKQFQKNRYI